MSTVTQIEQAIQQVFGAADTLAKQSGFVQRERAGKFTEASFAAACECRIQCQTEIKTTLAPCSRYTALVKPTLSPMTVRGPMGSSSGSAMLSFSNSVLLFHTFLRKSAKTWIVNCSLGQRRYPKPKGA